MKKYITPQTEAQTISVNQLICNSGEKTIQKGDPIGGDPSQPIIIG